MSDYKVFYYRGSILHLYRFITLYTGEFTERAILIIHTLCIAKLKAFILCAYFAELVSQSCDIYVFESLYLCTHAAIYTVHADV